ncbi:hypothetical protein OH77DRAFT_93416 [Trametes cingulata]|nr:hypothetical protein OH77DRAFT_93416 [Trametes cingulata]
MCGARYGWHACYAVAPHGGAGPPCPCSLCILRCLTALRPRRASLVRRRLHRRGTLLFMLLSSHHHPGWIASLGSPPAAWPWSNKSDPVVSLAVMYHVGLRRAMTNSYTSPSCASPRSSSCSEVSATRRTCECGTFRDMSALRGLWMVRGDRDIWAVSRW